MSVITPFRRTSIDLDELTLSDRRHASWLKTNYSDDVWIVTDTDDDEVSATIDFRYRLADGRLLTNDARLYGTVKEYAFFVRDPRFSRIDTAQTHASAVSQQLALAHALSHRQLASYAHLQRQDVEELVQAIRFGVDGVLRASERVAAYIAQIEADPTARTRPYAGFPVARTAAGHSKNMIDPAAVMVECNLPSSAKMLPRVSWLIRQAALRNGMSHYGELAAEIPALSNVTKQALQRWLDSIDMVYVIRHDAECETLAYRPFPNGVMRVANRWGIDPVKTPVPPTELVLRLLEASATWIAHHSQAVVTCLSELEQGGDVTAAVAKCRASFSPSLTATLGDESTGNDDFVERLVEMLVTACWIPIAAFTARRYEETIELGPDALSGEDVDGWFLDCLISKTTRQRESLPVPLIVARSVQVLSDISLPARKAGADSLFSWLRPGSLGMQGIREFKPRKSLNSFADIVGARDMTEGEERSCWHWVPRQFRRFFAVLYFYRFEGADIAVLSYFLRHFDIETTRGYVTADPEIAKMWHDAGRDYVRRLAESIASGERVVGGAMGERLKKLTKLITERLRKHLFVSKEAVGEALQHAMERGGLVITPKAWVTCTCPRTRKGARKARCRAGQVLSDDIVGPSFADAGPPVCKDCPWALLEPEKCANASSEQQTHLAAAVECKAGSGTLFRDLQNAHLVELRAFADTPFSRTSSHQSSGEALR